MPKIIRKAVKCYLIKDNKVLITKYKKGNRKEGYYDIPGGKIEEGELPEETAIREMKEETGIKVSNLKFKGNLEVEYPDRIFKFDVFIANEYEGKPQEFEENISEWIDINCLLKKEKLLSNVILLDKFFIKSLIDDNYKFDMYVEVSEEEKILSVKFNEKDALKSIIDNKNTSEYKDILKDENNSNYIKRYSAYNMYKDKKINNDLITFYYQFNHLKNIYRQGWIKSLIGPKKIFEIESIADHSWSVAMLAITIIEKYNLDYDITKCMKLSIIHELGEIYGGDFTPIDKISKEEKHKIERESIQKLLNTISFKTDFLELWEEYERQETKEAIFIKQLDKLECIMQGSSYGLDIYYMKNGNDKINLPYLKEILDEIKEITMNNEIPFVIKNKINQELLKYIEDEIFPLYNKNEEGHGIKHIKTVIKRSIKLAQKYDVNLDMVYTIASYHDIGHHIDPKKHEIVSAQMFMEDENIKKWFTDEQITIIKEAIEDHRASSKNKPRSIYGMIISTADRTLIDIDFTIWRTYSYGLKNYPEIDYEEHLERVYLHLSEKYGENGYAKIYLEDEEFDNQLKKLRKALENKDEFINRVKRVIKEKLWRKMINENRN